MRRFKVILILLVVINIVCIGSMGYVQPKIPKEKVPGNIPVDVREQIERLYSDDPLKRGRAARSLGEMGARAIPAIPFLIEMLDDTSLLVLWKGRSGTFTSPGEEAAKALGEIKDPVAIEPLVTTLKDKIINAQENAAEALGKIDPNWRNSEVARRAIPSFIAALRDPDPKIRTYTAHALGLIQNPCAVEPLIVALQDKYEGVKIRAAEALAEIRDKRAVESLIIVLEDKDKQTRQAAAEALGKIGDPRAVEPLITALRDEYWGVRKAAAEALGKIGEVGAIEPLLATLKDDHTNVRYDAKRGI